MDYFRTQHWARLACSPLSRTVAFLFTERRGVGRGVKTLLGRHSSRVVKPTAGREAQVCQHSPRVPPPPTARALAGPAGRGRPHGGSGREAGARLSCGRAEVPPGSRTRPTPAEPSSCSTTRVPRPRPGPPGPCRATAPVAEGPTS